MRTDRRPDIHLYIDRLILDGLPVEQVHAPQVRRAVKSELTRLLTEKGLDTNLQAGGAVPSVPANGIQLLSGNNPSQIGTQIAKSVYSGIGTKR